MANKVYDALIIPTGETTSGERSFPVTKEAIKKFRTGRYGCIFVTGGYGGFATKERRCGISEAQETVEYLLKNDIPLEKIYYDGRSLETVGNFTFPIVNPTHKNPSLMEFNNMEIYAKEGHMWRVKDYAKIVMPEKFGEGKIALYYIPGEHNNGLAAKVYHKGLMEAIDNHLFENTASSSSAAGKVHDFLIKKHPFYSQGWYDKSPLVRKAEMALTGIEWLMK